MDYRKSKEVDDAVTLIEWMRDQINELEGIEEKDEEEFARLNKIIEEKDTRIEELEAQIEEWRTHKEELLVENEKLESEVATLLEQIKTQ